MGQGLRDAAPPSLDDGLDLPVEALLVLEALLVADAAVVARDREPHLLEPGADGVDVWSEASPDDAGMRDAADGLGQKLQARVRVDWKYLGVLLALLQVGDEVPARDLLEPQENG